MNAHIHNYTKLIGIREYGTTNGWGGTSEYIQRLILARQCSCKAYLAFDCGSPEEMKELYTELRGNK